MQVIYPVCGIPYFDLKQKLFVTSSLISGMKIIFTSKGKAKLFTKQFMLFRKNIQGQYGPENHSSTQPQKSYCKSVILDN